MMVTRSSVLRCVYVVGMGNTLHQVLHLLLETAGAMIFNQTPLRDQLL